jgi:hypothetical protein
LTSPPTQNALPAPVSTTTRTSGSASSNSSISRSAGVTMSPSALRFSGRLKVSVATWLRIPTMPATYSDPMPAGVPI